MVKKANEESDIQPVVSLIGNKSENYSNINTQRHINTLFFMQGRSILVLYLISTTVFSCEDMKY